MKQTHSLGPWIAHNRNVADALDIDAADGTRITSINLETSHIAFDASDPSDTPEKELAMYLANAALIVAAPDLLDAVNHVLIASEDGGDMDDIDFTMLRAAIAKAKTQLSVVYSATEYTNSDGAGFWSNANGWTSLCQATLFSKEHGEKMNMPISAGNDAKLVLRVEVGKHALGQISSRGV